MSNIVFDKDLLFGVATASTQIEGGDTNNTWYDWTKNHDKTNDKTDTLLANSHWENYKEHIDLMSSLSFQIYRLSLEWSRIEPTEGNFDLNAINHYRDELNYLLSKNIKPLVTLHHFSNPIWFEAKGGFKNKKYSVECFSRYTSYVVNNLGDLVSEWCTINEPNVYATSCFLFGEWINEEKNFFTTMKVIRNMADCHISAYKIIHDIQKESKVGIALNINTFIPKRKNNIIDRFTSWFMDLGFNLSPAYAFAYGKLMFPLGLSFRKGDFFDFFGINYYTTRECKGFGSDFVEGSKRNDLNWTICSANFRKEIIRFNKLFNKDIYITENGTCDKIDSFRPKFICDHLEAFADLKCVKRYYHWTFMDNFEWKEGQAICFGLVKYNYNDKTYEPRPSAYLYKEIIEKHQITDNMKEKYGVKQDD